MGEQQMSYWAMFDPECGCDYCESLHVVYNETQAWKADELGTRPRQTGKEKIENPDAADYMLNCGVSVVRAVGRSGEEKWLTQRYAVKQEWIRKILRWLKCGTPMVDMFADGRNARFPRFWGEGGECSDAWKESWARTELLWCNPPFTDLDFVVQKAHAEGTNMILIAPQWDGRKYHDEMWEWSREHCYIKPGSDLFELDGKEAGPTRWGTWGVWIDTNLTRTERDRRRAKWKQVDLKSDSSRRRYRRERNQDAVVTGVLKE